jgi:hypothetical protein
MISHYTGWAKKMRRFHAVPNLSRPISNLVNGAKVNGEYYCDRVLGRGLLCDIQVKCGRHERAEHHLTQPETLNFLLHENITFIVLI